MRIFAPSAIGRPDSSTAANGNPGGSFFSGGQLEVIRHLYSHPMQRRPVKAMQPIVAPTAWTPQDLREVSSWSYRLGELDRAELIAATQALKGVALEEVSRANFKLSGMAKVMADVRRDLLEGRGIVMLQNFPVDRLDREGQAIAYLGIGAYLGERISQNREGHILGHVKDLGGDYADPNTRGYMTRAEMRFHTDPCDYVGLLCLQTAKNGGASRIASSVSVYNRMVAQRPDLAGVLADDLYSTRGGEVNPGEKPWFKQP